MAGMRPCLSIKRARARFFKAAVPCSFRESLDFPLRTLQENAASVIAYCLARSSSFRIFSPDRADDQGECGEAKQVRPAPLFDRNTRE